MSSASEAYRRKVAVEERFVRVGEGRYRLDVREFGVSFEIDRLRRESGALVGELVVHCEIPGARTFDGVLTAGDLNLSSVRARQDRGKYLSDRAGTPDVDFVGLLEELAQRVIAKEREGEPGVLLRELPRPTADDAIRVEGLPLLRRHPVMVFGDGGAAKSYIALYLAGRLEQMGIHVGLFDWELSGEDHRDRLERIFGPQMPGIFYARCSRPLVHEADRLRRFVQDESLDFVVFDSVAFACDGPPEAAEVAGRYFQTLRQLGTFGSLQIAHISKAEGSDQKPFGSAFWHNGSRATWFVKLADEMPESKTITVGLYNRKANLGARKPAVGFKITFGDERTDFRPVNVADVPDLAGQLSVRQRMALMLRGGSRPAEELAEELQADPETIKRTARRYKDQFTVLNGGKLGLAARP